MLSVGNIEISIGGLCIGGMSSVAVQTPMTPIEYETFNVTDNGGEAFVVTDGGGEDFDVR